MTKTPVRYLMPGMVCTMTNEKVLAVTPIRWAPRNNRYASTHRNVCLEKADGTKRWAIWNASTIISIEEFPVTSSEAVA